MSTLIAKDTAYNAFQDIQESYKKLVESNKKLKIRLNRKINGQKQQANLKKLIGDKIYYKLLLLEGIILDSDGCVVKFDIWNGDCMLYKCERKQLSFRIKELKILPNLKYINLNCTNIKGNIYDLKSLPKLTKIYLSHTGVTGDIAQLKSLSNLENISVYNTGVSGDPKLIKEMPKFKDIWLDSELVVLELSDDDDE